MKTDFERAQLKYYNFLRDKNSDLQYDDDDHYHIGYITKYHKIHETKAEQWSGNYQKVQAVVSEKV